MDNVFDEELGRIEVKSIFFFFDLVNEKELEKERK